MINIEAIKERDRKLLEEAKQKDYDYIHECFKVAYQKVLECLESGEYRDSDGDYRIPFEELLPEDFEESLGNLNEYTAITLLQHLLELNLATLSISLKGAYIAYHHGDITVSVNEKPDIWHILACNQRQIVDYYKSCIFVTTSISIENYTRGFKYSPIKNFDIYDKAKEDDFIRWFKAEIEESPDESEVTPDSDRSSGSIESRSGYVNEKVEINPETRKSKLFIYYICCATAGILTGYLITTT